MIPFPYTMAGLGGAHFNPASLFASGEKGVAFDFSDASKLYQDSARTTPVTAASDPIGSVTDLSGNGLHGAQTTAGSRPVWGTDYATFDGTDDFLVTAAIDLTAANEITLIMGYYVASDAAVAIAAELSANVGTNNGSFSLTTPQAAGVASSRLTMKGTTAVSITPTRAAAPAWLTLVASGDISAPLTTLEINGAPFSSSSSLGTGNFGNHALYLGRRGGTTLPLNGRIARVILIGRLLTGYETTRAKAWIAAPYV